MRFLFLILFVLGAAAGLATPFISGGTSGEPLGTWRVYQPAAGFHSVDVPLTPADAPLRMVLDLLAPGPFVPDSGTSSATLTVTHNNESVFAKPIPFRDAVVIDDNPQTPERAFRVQAGTLPALEQGTYTFTVTRGEAEIPQVTGFDLVLERGAPAYLRLAQPLGFAAAAIGFVGFMLTAFRRNRSAPAPEAKPRWGRDAAQD